MISAVPDVAGAVLLLAGTAPGALPALARRRELGRQVGGGDDSPPSPAGRLFLSLVVKSELSLKSQAAEV